MTWQPLLAAIDLFPSPNQMLLQCACKTRSRPGLKSKDSDISVKFWKHFSILIDAAEEEGFKEAVLAYYFLLTTKDPLTKNQLDDRIENWLAENWNCHIDFEIGDAVNKLQRMKLISVDADDLRCVPLSVAKEQLDSIWDNFFTYNQKEVTSDLK